MGTNYKPALLGGLANQNFWDFSVRFKKHIYF